MGKMMCLRFIVGIKIRYDELICGFGECLDIGAQIRIVEYTVNSVKGKIEWTRIENFMVYL